MFVKAVELNPLSPWAHFRLGWVYIRNGEKNKGIDHLKKSLEYDPNNCDVLTKLGEVLMREQAGVQEAEEYLKRALAIDENMPDALVALGRVLEKKNEIDQAMECYEKAIK
jgi:tetratricopeptide (TPR) repeat protein